MSGRSGDFGVKNTSYGGHLSEKAAIMADVPILLTVGALARKLDAPLHRVEYILSSRNVQPVGRAGNARVFQPADLDFVKSELRRIDEERNGGHTL